MQLKIVMGTLKKTTSRVLRVKLNQNSVQRTANSPRLNGEYKLSSRDIVQRS